MRGEPDGAKKKNNAKEQFRRDGDGAPAEVMVWT